MLIFGMKGISYLYSQTTGGAENVPIYAGIPHTGRRGFDYLLIILCSDT
jgi:hypothetical protein